MSQAGSSQQLTDETNDDAGNDKTGNGKREELSLLVDITMEGGSGRAYIQSPVEVKGYADDLKATLVWSSPNYDYMLVDGIRYDNENTGGSSTFTIPVGSLEEPLTVIADTVAMSTPHEIEYTIYWGESRSAGSDGDGSEDSANRSRESDISTDENTGKDSYKISGIGESNGNSASKFPELANIGKYSKSGELKLKYATQFTVSLYEDYRLIRINNSGDYLLVPEGREVPEGIPKDIVVLKQPLDKTYLVSSSAMDLISECGCLDMLRFSGTKGEDWHIEAAAEAMKDGRILYAGKYRAPDYELILSEGCNLAIENTMIYHNPEVKEKLEELGIPVLVETSSYESHPLGRLEWIKLYGILFGEEDRACSYYDRQLKELESVMDMENTGKKVAFFHVTANGLINVRKSNDYIATMIELAGGDYVPVSSAENPARDEASPPDSNELSGKVSDPAAVTSTATMNMQMEDFYASAYDADILIYNSTITGEISSVDELIRKNELFSDFKAVKNGQVYCTRVNLFQKTTGTADFMKDLHNVFTGSDTDLTYMTRLN